MSAYIVQDGDTFETISRSVFGTADRAADIISANPGAASRPSPGTTLFVPKAAAPSAPPDVRTDEVSVVIDGKRFVGWTDVAFTREMDAFGTFDLRSVWEPSNRVFRDAFRPFGFQSVAIFSGRDLLFNGTMVNVMPAQSAASRTVTASGYSVPGVLNDCTPPASALPLERDRQNLIQIAEALLKPFGIPVDAEADAGATFQREALDPTTRVLDYLIKLAKQRKLIITDTPGGACKFQTESDTGRPVAALVEGQPGITSVVPQFNPQEYYSHVTGQGFTLFAAPDALPGKVHTVTNNRLPGVLRPLTFSVPDVIGADIKAAAEAKAGRMFANAVSYTVEVPSWRDPSGDLWQPNTTMRLRAPGAMIYRDYEFLIRSVRYARNATSETATLTLCLPGVFSGKIPEVLPWEG